MPTHETIAMSDKQMFAFKKYFFGYLILVSSAASAQNLVVDGSFEDLKNPTSGNGLLLEDYLNHWGSYVTTPDYYSTVLWSPQGVLNYCNTLPRTGDAMVGGYTLGFFSSIGYNREFIQGELSAPLKPNTIYYAEVYVKPYKKPPVLNWAIRNIGIAVTDKLYDKPDSFYAHQFLIPETAIVEHQSAPIDDLNNWTKISGCFMAKGGETRIIIGNFSTDDNTDKQLFPGVSSTDDFSYYFFDDLSLVEIGTASITPDTTICSETSLIITASYPNASSYLWNTGATTSSIEVAEAGVYTVQITTAQGCTITASTTVKIKDCTPPTPPLPGSPSLPSCPALLLPDAFTPNDDGRNDEFHILNPNDVQLLDMSIYNRWGEQVFYTRDISKGWDGTYKGERAEMGVYAYQLKYMDCYGQQVYYKKGMLTLIR